MIKGIKSFKKPFFILVFFSVFSDSRIDAEDIAPLQSVQFKSIEESPVFSKEGTINLAWEWKHKPENTEGWDFELEQSIRENFKASQLRYRGADTATFISGLRNGTFYYRIRAISPQGAAGPWAKKIFTVEVQYASKHLVLILMIVGAIVFVATAVMIGLGHWRMAR